MDKVLLCGGAGYIGSHVFLSLLRSGMLPVIVDNFANSDPSVLRRLRSVGGAEVHCHEADLADRDAVMRIFNDVAPSAVIQLAGLKSVEESFKVPMEYYAINLSITLNVLAAMSRYSCSRIVFSSSATVYGNPLYTPIDENHVVSPISPYGRTKFFQEEIIRDWVESNKNVSAVILRYFNPVGADASGIIGEEPNNVPMNLLPILGDVAVGWRPEVVVFGNDYDTRDGTCERDYIHVSDLADAHVAALDFSSRHDFEIFNVGTGRGVTVREAIDTYADVFGSRLSEGLGARRPGDVPSSIAANDKIFEQLNWRPRRSFEDACRDDIKWRRYVATRNIMR